LHAKAWLSPTNGKATTTVPACEIAREIGIVAKANGNYGLLIARPGA
jgi:UDP-N-acetylmuramoylalanine-D-glutamate ligase